MIIRKNVLNAVSWSALDLLFQYGINFLAVVILARVLPPSDFGLVAMLALFVSLSGLLIDSGFSQALIQRRDATHTDESTIFFFTLLMAAVVASSLCIAAPWIAMFYEQPILEPMVYWMALNLLINSFGTIHTTLLTKGMDFRTIMKVGGGASSISACLAVAMAMQGWGVWSLVGQAISATLVTVVLLWLLHPWRPRWVFDFASLRSCFRFGGFVLLTGFFYTVYTNLYGLLIGKLHSVQNVGFYAQAQRLQQLPVNLLTNIVGRVAFPAFAAAADDKARLARGMREALTSVMFINIPLMIGISVLAEPLVLTLFGSSWLPSVPVLRVLTVVGLMWPMHALNINVLKAQGHSALNARLQLIKLSVGISLLVAASPYGIVAIACGQVMTSVLAFFVNTHYTRVFLNYGGLAQLRDIAPCLAASVPMIFVIRAVMTMNLPSQIVLAVATLTGSMVYLGASRMANLQPLHNLVEMIFRRTN